MNEYLNRPYPSPIAKKISHSVLWAFLFSVFIYVFLLIFQPLGISNIQHYKQLFILGYFVITFIIEISCYVVAPIIFKFDADKWTIKKNTLLVITSFLLGISLFWIYNNTIGKEIVEQYSLFYLSFIVISIAILPTFFSIMLKERIFSRRNQYFASTFTKSIEHRTNKPENAIIKLVSKNKDEIILIELNQLLAIKAEGNYLNVFFLEENVLKSKLIRNSILNIEKELIIFEKVKRCHRSYIVNLEKVKKMTGNARNLDLHIPFLNFSIPVSRSFPRKVFKELNM